MNKERILKLADVIEATPHKPEPKTKRPNSNLRGFNMASWHCGTVGCIAGWAGKIFDCHYAYAGEALDLPWATSDALFMAKGIHWSRMDQIKPAHAAAVLRHLAETGKVDWSVSP